MNSLFKRTIGFTSVQMTWLREKAKELEISIADLVRRAVDEYRKR